MENFMRKPWHRKPYLLIPIALAATDPTAVGKLGHHALVLALIQTGSAGLFHSPKHEFSWSIHLLNGPYRRRVSFFERCGRMVNPNTCAVYHHNVGVIRIDDSLHDFVPNTSL